MLPFAFSVWSIFFQAARIVGLREAIIISRIAEDIYYFKITMPCKHTRFKDQNGNPERSVMLLFNVELNSAVTSLLCEENQFFPKSPALQLKITVKAPPRGSEVLVHAWLKRSKQYTIVTSSSWVRWHIQIFQAVFKTVRGEEMIWFLNMPTAKVWNEIETCTTCLQTFLVLICQYSNGH